jgi:hypothetical protein
VKLTLFRSARLESVRVRSAPAQPAQLRLALLRLAALRKAPVSLAPAKLAPEQSAPVKSAPARSARPRLAPARSASSSRYQPEPTRMPNQYRRDPTGGIDPGSNLYVAGRHSGQTYAPAKSLFTRQKLLKTARPLDGLPGLARLARRTQKVRCSTLETGLSRRGWQATES